MLGTIGDTFVQTGLVRQGHAVTQVSITGLEFQSPSTGKVYGPCGSFTSTMQTDASFQAAWSGRRLAHHSGHHCNEDHGGGSHPCPSADYPKCVGFVQGSGWGKCWSVCTAVGGHPNLWGELSVWGDSISFELAWDAEFDLGGDGCTGAITVTIGPHSRTTVLSGARRRLHSEGAAGTAVVASTPDHATDHVANEAVADDFATAPPMPRGVPGEHARPAAGELLGQAALPDLHEASYFPSLEEGGTAGHSGRERMGTRVAQTDGDHRSVGEAASELQRGRDLSTAEQRRVSLVFHVAPNGSALLLAQPSPHPIAVTSAAGRWVLSRAAIGDVIIEVPTSVGTCGYNTGCSSMPLALVDVVVSNPHPTEPQAVRLTFSRNFQVREAALAQSGPGAEITGLSTQLWETATRQPSGIPMHTSKNWHTGSTAAYWAGFDGYWWTANSMLRLPPNSSVALSLALNYERYGGLPAWSHAQLSIVGYSDRWLWEQAALGSGGENICYDPLGSHTRAFITDVRPKLFDGSWKENVGGGDFMSLFSAGGQLQYLKRMDPQLHANGPCLSSAEYTAVTLDDAISSRYVVRGGRTDDLVRVYMDVQLEAHRDLAFSRLFFFQQTSETYSYRATHGRFGWGGDGVPSTLLTQDCFASQVSLIALQPLSATWPWHVHSALWAQSTSPGGVRPLRQRSPCFLARGSRTRSSPPAHASKVMRLLARNQHACPRRILSALLPRRVSPSGALA